jgi:hypothetical protein
MLEALPEGGVTKTQEQLIRDHLELVFTKVTPERSEVEGALSKGKRPPTIPPVMTGGLDSTNSGERYC